MRTKERMSWGWALRRAQVMTCPERPPTTPQNVGYEVSHATECSRAASAGASMGFPRIHGSYCFYELEIEN